MRNFGKKSRNDANYVSSHCFFKMESTEDGGKKQQATIVSPGNQDSEKGDLKTDAGSACMTAVKTLVSMRIISKSTLTLRT